MSISWLGFTHSIHEGVGFLDQRVSGDSKRDGGLQPSISVAVRDQSISLGSGLIVTPSL